MGRAGKEGDGTGKFKGEVAQVFSLRRPDLICGTGIFRGFGELTITCGDH